MRPLTPHHTQPLPTPQLEYMITSADNAVTGHIGYDFVVSEGNHQDVARRFAEMLSYTRICKGCLERVWRPSMSAKEAVRALSAARDECDAFTWEGSSPAEGQWTVHRCSSCVQDECDCYCLFVLGGALDCGGNQAGLIRASFDETLESEEPPYYDGGGKPLYGLPLLPDAAHFNKLLDSGLFHHKIWLDGSLCGAFQLWSRFYDADPSVRRSVREELTAVLLRRKNAFSVEDAVARRERALLETLLSDEERTQGVAWMISQLGPSRSKQWRENTAAMYGAPMGCAFDPASNLLFWVDRELREAKVMKLSHTPADVATFTVRPNNKVTSQLRTPVGIALVTTTVGEKTWRTAYITDEDLENPRLYFVSIAHICKNFNDAQRVAEGEEAKSSKGAIHMGRVAHVQLSGGVLLQPYGIATDTLRNELYVGDRQAKAIYRVIFSEESKGVLELIGRLASDPLGLDVVPQRAELVVAAGDAIYIMATGDGATRRIFKLDDAKFCGVSVSPESLGGSIFAIDNAGNAVWRIEREETADETAAVVDLTWPSTMLVGGNKERPCSGMQSLWYEGTACKVELFQPTLGCFARNAFIFMNTGSGSFGKVLLLNDMVPMATKMLPVMIKAADAFGLTRDSQHHAVNRLHASLQLHPLVDLLQQIEDDNAEFNTRRGLEGPMGNFSNVVRRSAVQLETLLLQQVENAMRIGSPQRCLDALSPCATMTLNVETFFISQRSHTPNPYPLQYAQRWATAVLVESYRSGAAVPFSAARNQRRGRGHYHKSGADASAPRRYQPMRVKHESIDPTKRKRILRILRCAAGLFKQVRQGRVTDKGKERVGSQPATTYAPGAVPPATAKEAARPSVIDLGSSGHSSVAGSTSGGASSSVDDLIESTVLYRSGDVVSVRPISGGMWIAQLKVAIVKNVTVTSGRRYTTFNLDRAPCRYFVPTMELGSYPHALKLWANFGPKLRLVDEAAAEQCAQASSGVHFSFEKLDHVTCSTVCGKLDTVIDPTTHRGELVSFAIDEEMLQQAREWVSGRIDPDADGDDGEAERDAASEAAAAASDAAEKAVAADALSTARLEDLNAKREAGKRLEAERKSGKK